MQELAEHVFIETGYAGVTLGAINWPHGLILIDAPFRAEDVRSWRSALLNLGGGVERLMINLDAHLDRTIGGRAMDCTIIGHEKMADVFRNRPVTFKTQGTETGAEWEQYSGLGSIRWAPPEITFTEQLIIHAEDKPLILETHCGAATGAIWAILPEQRVIFIGDCVVPKQPPFLSSANLSCWIKDLEELLSPTYQNYLFVSGRGGPIVREQVRTQLGYLRNVQQAVEELAHNGGFLEDTEQLIRPLLTDFEIPAQFLAQYEQRLRHGLQKYYARHYQTVSEEIVE